jgi:hypothetical protein
MERTTVSRLTCVVEQVLFTRLGVTGAYISVLGTLREFEANLTQIT